MKKSFLITVIITLLGLYHTQGQSVYWEQSADNTSSGNLSIGSIAANSYSKLVIKGPNQPLNSGGKRDLSFEFAAAGKAQIRSYRGGSWDTYMQFLTTPVSGGDPVPQMHISHDGKIGIGTTTPVHLLHLKSAVPYMRFELNNGSYSMIEWLEASTRVAGIHWVGHQTPNRLSFMTGVSSISEQMSITETGNVGIGTTTPDMKFSVYSAENSLVRFHYTGSSTISGFRLGRSGSFGDFINLSSGFGIGAGSSSGNLPLNSQNLTHVDLFINSTTNNVGIGTTTPLDRLTVTGGNVTIGNTTNQEYSLTFRPSDNTARNALVGYSSNTVAADYIGLKSNWGSIRFSTNGGNEVVRITANERVGIGTSDPQSKLAVEGTIRAKEIKVMEVIGAPDYVFEADYNLRTLEATKAYIEENKHLPEIPSAAEMEANGIELGDMNMRLLKKIEELTLYMIEINKQVQELKAENQSLKAQISH